MRSYFWSVFSCIRTEYRKIRTRNNSVFGHFSRTVCSSGFIDAFVSVCFFILHRVFWYVFLSWFVHCFRFSFATMTFQMVMTACVIDLHITNDVTPNNNKNVPFLNRATAQKLKFSIKTFFSNCDHIHNFLWIWSHLLKKSLMQNFIFRGAWFLALNEWSNHLRHIYGKCFFCKHIISSR